MDFRHEGDLQNIVLLDLDANASQTDRGLYVADICTVPEYITYICVLRVVEEVQRVST